MIPFDPALPTDEAQRMLDRFPEWGDERLKRLLSPIRFLPFHGRCDPDQDMDCWGFDGPPIYGIVSITETYCTDVRLFFENPVITMMYHELTGWRFWDGSTLLVACEQDMVYMPNVPAWFGDWGYGWHNNGVPVNVR